MSITYGAVELHTYGNGTLAYLDTIATGLVPCRVVAVTTTRDAPIQQRVTARVMATRGAYRVGEFVTMSPAHVVPRDHVYRSNYHFRIRTCYRWETANAVCRRCQATILRTERGKWIALAGPEYADRLHCCPPDRPGGEHVPR